MAEQTADNEPSMEEILSSIRRIINEDDDEAPAAEAAPAEEESNSQGDVDAMFDNIGEDEGEMESLGSLQLGASIHVCESPPPSPPPQSPLAAHLPRRARRTCPS